MIHTQKPFDFNPWYHTVSVFIFSPEGKVLFLRRGEDKSEGGKFGTPGGKKEKNETSSQTAIREIFEETGIDIKEKELKLFRQVFVRYPDHDFVFEMFESHPKKLEDVRINLGEHSEFTWATLDDALKTLPLVKDMDACIKLFKNFRQSV